LESLRCCEEFHEPTFHEQVTTFRSAIGPLGFGSIRHGFASVHLQIRQTPRWGFCFIPLTFCLIPESSVHLRCGGFHRLETHSPTDEPLCSEAVRYMLAQAKLPIPMNREECDDIGKTSIGPSSRDRLCLERRSRSRLHHQSQ
jgi:hypothetical protein